MGTATNSSSCSVACLFHDWICKFYVLIIYIYIIYITCSLISCKVPASIMNVIEEKTLKDKRSVNLFYFLFWSSLYQLIAMVLMFWTDIIPGFGYTNGINDFGKK